MDFSDPLDGHGKSSSFSPDGRHLATVNGRHLLIIDAETLKVESKRVCLPASKKQGGRRSAEGGGSGISIVRWSPDSLFVFCAHFKRGLVQVFSLEAPKWTCKISQGDLGLTWAYWSPDSAFILTISHSNLRVSIWNLHDKNDVAYIKRPKFSNRGLSFTHDGEFMALLERREFKDVIGVYHCGTWKQTKVFEVATEDAADLCWSPDDRFLAIWDQPENYGVVICRPDGQPMARLVAYKHALGVKTVRWSPCSKLLAVGSYDQRVRVFAVGDTFPMLAVYEHPNKICGGVAVYTEKADCKEDGKENAVPIADATTTEACDVMVVRPDGAKGTPKLGIGMMEWSADSSFLATRNDTMPSTLWVWKTRSLSLTAVLRQKTPIRQLEWAPAGEQRLVIACATNSLFLWMALGASVIRVPIEDFTIRALEWDPIAAASLLLADRTRICACTMRPYEALTNGANS